MTLNILSEKGKEEFKQRFFTEQGHNTLVNYGNNLAEMYFTKKAYPFRIGIIFGLPFFKFANEVKSKDELIGRIKLLMRLTGQEEIKIKLGDSEVSLKFKED